MLGEVSDKKKRFVVKVEGKMVVEVAVGMLDAIDDIGLADSIVEEAIKLEVCDRLGGLDAVRISKYDLATSATPPPPPPTNNTTTSLAPVPSFLAKVKFAELSNSILSLQGEYDRLVSSLESMKEVVTESLEDTDAPAKSHDVLKALKIALEEACTPSPIMPRLIPEWEAEACESETDNEEKGGGGGGSSSGSSPSEGGLDPMEGYQLMDDGPMDDEDGDDEEDEHLVY